MKFLRQALVTALLFTPLSAFADDVTFETATGPMTIEATPERVVVLDVSAIDTMNALGVTPAGVVSRFYVDYLPEPMPGAETVGTFFEPDMEAIAALAPDMIIVGGRSAPMAEGLSRIAPVADMTMGTDAVVDGKARLAAYGKMLGREAEAAALADQLDTKLAEVREMVQSQSGTALILMTSGPKLSVFGPKSRFGWLHTELGFETAIDGITESSHGEAVSFEFIAEANPDVLIVVDRAAAIAAGNDAAAATLDTPLIAGTSAGQSGRIIYLSPAELYIATGGVQSLMRSLDELSAALGGA